MRTKLFYVVAILLSVASCKDDAPQTLVLNVPQQDGNSITLTWEQPEISDFQYYAVMRASNGQNYTIINDILNTTSDAFNKEITTFTDNSYPLEADILYYKVMAVGNGTISSENTLFQNGNKATLLKGDFRYAYYLEDENKLSVAAYSYDNNEYQLKVFDLQSGQFLPNEASIYLSSSCSGIFWGRYNGNHEAYNYDCNYNLNCYDAKTTQHTASFTIPDIGYEPYTVNNKGMIYIYRFCLFLVNRSTGTYTQYYPNNQMYWADFLYYNSKDNKLYAIDESNYGRFVTFNLNEDGGVVSDEVFAINSNNSTPIFIENSSLFIVNTNGQYKILDMNTKDYHPFAIRNLNSGTKAILVGNNIYLYGSNIISVNSNTSIYQVSTTDYQLTNTYTLRTNNVRQIFYANGYLYYLGEYSNNIYLLDKIKL